MGERGERFFYLRGNGIPDTSTPQEKLLRMLSARHPPEEIDIPQTELVYSHLREILSNKETLFDKKR